MAASITILDVAIVLLCKLLYSRETTTLEDITLCALKTTNFDYTVVYDFAIKVEITLVLYFFNLFLNRYG